MHPVDVSGHVATFVGAVLAAPVCALEFAGVDVVLIGRLVFRFVERPGGKKRSINKNGNIQGQYEGDALLLNDFLVP